MRATTRKSDLLPHIRPGTNSYRIAIYSMYWKLQRDRYLYEVPFSYLHPSYSLERRQDDA